MEHITIISTYSEAGYLKTVIYSNKYKLVKIADFSKQKIDCNNINIQNLKKQL